MSGFEITRQRNKRRSLTFAELWWGRLVCGIGSAMRGRPPVPSSKVRRPVAWRSKRGWWTPSVHYRPPEHWRGRPAIMWGWWAPPVKRWWTPPLPVKQWWGTPAVKWGGRTPVVKRRWTPASSSGTPTSWRCPATTRRQWGSISIHHEWRPHPRGETPLWRHVSRVVRWQGRVAWPVHQGRIVAISAARIRISIHTAVLTLYPVYAVKH